MAAMDLPPEVVYNVLEHVDSLNDLGSLSLTNKWMAELVGNIRAKTLWRITMRTGDSCTKECESHDDSGHCWCGLMESALGQHDSRPWKVRAWLYRRASMRSFGHSKESLEWCQVPIHDFNPYHVETEGPCLASWSGMDEEYDDDNYREVRGWSLVWMEFIRHLTMQRVQRVNTGDARARAEWTRGYWERSEDRTAVMSSDERALVMKHVCREIGRQHLERTEWWGQEFLPYGFKKSWEEKLGTSTGKAVDRN